MPFAGAGVAEQAALLVALHDVVEVGLGDVLGPERIAGEEDGLGVVAGLGADVNRHGARLYYNASPRNRRGLRVPTLVDPGHDAGARVLLALAGRARLPRGDGAAGDRALRRASRGDDGELQALCHAGANLVPSGDGCAAFAETAVRSNSRMIIGEERAVDELWAAAGALDAGAAGGPAGPARLHDERRRRRRATPACARRRSPTSSGCCPRARPAHELELGIDPRAARRGRLPLAHARADRGRPLVALARGRRDPLQGRGLGLDAVGGADPAGLGRPGGARAAATRSAACATCAGCCSSRRRS